MNTIPLTENDIQEYLDKCINYWREKNDEGDERAVYYIDAFQSVRISLIGDTLALGEHGK